MAGVVNVENTATLPTGPTAVVLVISTAGSVLGCETDQSNLIGCCEVSHAFHVAAESVPTVNFMVNIPLL